MSGAAARTGKAVNKNIINTVKKVYRGVDKNLSTGLNVISMLLNATDKGQQFVQEIQDTVNGRMPIIKYIGKETKCFGKLSGAAARTGKENKK